MKPFLRLILVSFLLAYVIGAYAQINPARVAASKARSTTIRATDQAVDQTINAIENDASNKANNDNGDSEEAGEQQSDEQSAQPSGSSNNGKTGAAQQEQASLQSYSKFDFIPGQKVIFFDDFSQDNVGDFPALWNTNGSGEVVTTNLFPGHWLQVSGEYAVWTDKLLDLPDNYTIEFDVIPTENEEGNMQGYAFRLMQSINANSYDWGAVPGEAGFAYTVEYFGRPGYRTYINNEEATALNLSGFLDGEKYEQKMHQKYHISVWVQKSRIRLYQDEIKAVDLPKAFNFAGVKMDRIRFEYGCALVSNIRIAVGAPDTRNKLITEGKLVTYGIYFDVNKDVVKPESYGTLKDIANVLNENPDVRVKIVGHTDSDGNDASNLDLSKRRAESVKNELAKTFGISADRMETDGMGETQPVAPNDTPSNKALNRRVEFIKL